MTLRDPALAVGYLARHRSDRPGGGGTCRHGGDRGAAGGGRRRDTRPVRTESSGGSEHCRSRWPWSAPPGSRSPSSIQLKISSFLRHDGLTNLLFW